MFGGPLGSFLVGTVVSRIKGGKRGRNGKGALVSFGVAVEMTTGSFVRMTPFGSNVG